MGAKQATTRVDIEDKSTHVSYNDQNELYVDTYQKVKAHRNNQIEKTTKKPTVPEHIESHETLNKAHHLVSSS